LQNGAYTTAISDIGAEAGVAKLYELKIKYSVGASQVDLMIMSESRYAGLAGYLHTERQYMNDDKMAELGFDTIKLGNTTIGYENTNVLGGANTITAAYMYGINTKYMKLKHLSDPVAGKNGWSSNFERVGNSLNKAVFYNWFGNLVTNCPRAHFVATSVSTS
jgi:hypothetical protein